MVSRSLAVSRPRLEGPWLVVAPGASSNLGRRLCTTWTTAAWSTFLPLERRGKKVTFRDIHAGGIFGELAAIDSKPRSASVEATTHCTVAAMSPELFWEMLRSEQAVMTDVLKFLSERVRDLSERVSDLQTKDVRRRLLAELLRMAQPSETEYGNAVLFPAPTAGDIAARIGTTRETVARELSWLEKTGIIERRGRTLVIPDFKKLRTLVEEPEEDE